MNLCSIFSSQSLILFISINKDLFILRPPLSDIPFQFLNAESISLCVGIIDIVLSQFCIFTVCSAISITSPSAPNCGASIQSPTLNKLFELIWILATKDNIVSLKTKSKTAVIAPKPLSNHVGFFPINIPKIIIEHRIFIISFII